MQKTIQFFPDFTKEERKGCLLYFLTFQMDQITCPIQIRRRIQWPVLGSRLYFVFFVRPQLQMYHCWLIAVSFVNWDEVHKSDTCNKKSGSMKYSLGVVVSILPTKKGLLGRGYYSNDGYFGKKWPMNPYWGSLDWFTGLRLHQNTQTYLVPNFSEIGGKRAWLQSPTKLR